MANAVQMINDAILGTPPNPKNRPNTLKVIDAVTELYKQINIAAMAAVLSDAKAYPSVGAMNADLANRDTGSFAVVYAGADAGRGIYVKSGDAWVDANFKLSSEMITDIAALTSRVLQLELDFGSTGEFQSLLESIQTNVAELTTDVDGIQINVTSINKIQKPSIATLGQGVIFVDHDGFSGAPGRTIFVGRSMTLRRRGEATLVSVDLNPASVLPGYENFVQLTMPATSSAVVVYWLAEFNQYFLSSNPPATREDYVEIGIYYEERFTSSIFSVVEMGNTPAVCPRGYFFQQGGDLYIPHFFTWHPQFGIGDTTIAGPAGMFYKKITDFGYGVQDVLLIDLARASRNLDPFVVQPFYSQARNNFLMVAMGSFDMVTSPYPIYGTVAGGRVSNQMGIKRNEPENASYLLGNTIPIDTADTTMNTLGCTRVVYNPTTHAPYYGIKRFNYRKPGGYCHARVKVLTDTDDDVMTGAFPVAQLYLRGKNSAGAVVSNGSIIMNLVSKESKRVYIYEILYKHVGTALSIEEILVGPSAAKAGVEIYLGDAQISYNENPGAQDLLDFNNVVDDTTTTILKIPNQSDILFSNVMYLLNERPQSINIEGLYPTLQPSRGVRVTAGAINRGNARYSRNHNSKEDIVVDGRYMSGELVISSRPEDYGNDDRIFKRVRLRTVPAASAVGLTPIIHSLGDSTLSAGGKMPAVRDKLVSLGAFPSFQGTRIMRAYDHARICYGEGRAGRSAAGYAGFEQKDLPSLDPVIAGTELAYLALTDVEKQEFNPFMVPAPGGTDPYRVFGGYTFSYQGYLTRFNKATPTHVIFDIGINDAIHHGNAEIDDAVANVLLAIDIIGKTMLAELPDVYICFVTNPVGYQNNGNSVFDQRQKVNAAIFKAVAALNHPRAYVQASNALLGREDFSLNMVVNSTNTDLTITNETIADATHYIARPIEQYAEATTAWIVNTMVQDQLLQKQFEKMTVQPREIMRQAGQKIVDKIKATPGLYAKITDLGVFAWENDQQSLIKLIGTTDCVKIGNPVHTPLQGWNTSGAAGPTAAGINTKVNPVTSPGAITQNSKHFAFWSLTDDGDTTFDFGNTNDCISVRNGTTGNTTIRCSANSSNVFVAVKSSFGYFTINRTASGGYELYHDGVKVQDITRASDANVNLDYLVGSANGISETRNTRRYALFHTGSGLTAADVLVLYEAFLEFLFDLGSVRQHMLRPFIARTGPTPANNSTNQSRTPTIETEAAEHRYGKEIMQHDSTWWQIRTAANGGGTVVWESQYERTGKISMVVPVTLAANTTFYLRAAHRPDSGLISPFSHDRIFATGA